MQVKQYQNGLVAAIGSIYRSEGILGFYRGFQATLQREIPFACIQFPLYEIFKSHVRRIKANGLDLKPWEAATCGSVAGGVTAALTTPFDVAKTRIILSSKTERTQRSTWGAIARLYKEEGLIRLFSGMGPRVLWISFGGFIFFGAYEKAKHILSQSPKHMMGDEKR